MASIHYMPAKKDGEMSNSDRKDCDTCHGLGKVTLYHGTDATEITCPDCKGSSYIEIPEAAKTISPKVIGKGAHK